MEYDRQRQRLCSHCQRPVDKGKFHPNPIKPGSMYLCKECCTTMFRDVLSKTGSEGAALWAVCMANDLPLIREVYNDTIKTIENNMSGRRPTLFITYITLLKDYGDPLRGAYDSDMGLFDFIQSGDKETDDKQAKVDELIERRKIWEKTWGSNYDDEDCEWLDNMFEKYTGAIYDMDTAMEMRYRDLCRLELQRFKGDADKPVFDQIKVLMSMLKLDDFKENKVSDTEKFIDRWAWRIENESPAECEDLEKYKDYAGNESMWRDILRTVRNAISGSRDYPTL